jgi:hypothetical protein
VVTTLRDPGTVEVRRYPARLAHLPEESASVSTHRAAYDDEPDPVAAESASVIVREPVGDPAQAATWASEALREYPGAVLAAAAAGGGCVLAVRGGRTVLISGTSADRLDPMLLAAAGYALVRAGTFDDGPLALVAGGEPLLRLEVTAVTG